MDAPGLALTALIVTKVNRAREVDKRMVEKR